MIRWLLRLLSLVTVAGVACAQDSMSSAPLVANNAAHEAASANAVSPAVSPKEGRALTLTEVPPLPSGKATLLGGTIQTVDHLRDRLVLKVFGGNRTAVLFDERTRVFRDGKGASLDDLRNGERIYVDTTLDGTDIFARNIRISDQAAMGQSSGQIIDFRPESGELLVRDTISPEPVTMHLAGNALIVRGDKSARSADLRPGTLVTLTFIPGSKDAPIVQRISILATPGTAFVFSGRIAHLDLHRGLLVLVDPRDNKSYDLYFDPAARRLTRNLRQGNDVTVQASFDGRHYQSRDIVVNPGNSQ